MSWLEFAGVVVAFFVTHSVPVRPKVRAALVGRLGERGFTAAYSVLSLAMLAAVIAAAATAPFILLWSQAPWQHVIVMATMLVVCFIVAFSVGRPNPFSFAGARNDQFDPLHPGIVRWTRHPVLMALMLWSLLHLLPNGNLAHVILFGIFAAFAAAGTKLVDRRKKRVMGAGNWQSLLREVRNGPLLPRPTNLAGVAAKTIMALGLYAALILLHPMVIGVPVW